MVNLAGFILVSASLACSGDAPQEPTDGPQGIGVSGVAAFVEISPDLTRFERPGEVRALSARVRDARGRTLNGRWVRWTSLNPNVAKVDEQGRVTSVRKGEARIQALVDAVADTAQVYVDGDAAVATVVITPASATIPQAGANVTLSAQALDAQGNALEGRAITWASLDGAVATVSSTGNVFGLKAGSARIVASHESLADTADVVVGGAVPATIQVTPEVNDIASAGGSVQLSAVVRDRQGATIPAANVAWTSLDPSVATVHNGIALAVATGVGRIVAVAGAVADTAIVRVGGASGGARLQLTPRTDTIPNVGGTIRLSALVLAQNGVAVEGARIVWSSASPSVVAVTEAGVVAGVTKGVGHVVARYGALADTATIWVAPAPAAALPVAVRVQPRTDTLSELGATVQLTGTVVDAQGNPIGGKTIAWASLSGSIAKVSATGQVTAVAAGTARIVASHGSLTDTARVTVAPAVTPQPAAVNVQPAVDTIRVLGGTLQLTATVLDGQGQTMAGKTVTWASLNASIATVDATGKVTAVARGTATITATHGGRTGTAVIEIDPPAPVNPASHKVRVYVIPDSVADVGDDVRLEGIVMDAAGNAVVGAKPTWTSLDTAVFELLSAGPSRIVDGTADAPGTARLVASYANVADTVRVHIKAGPQPNPPASVRVSPAQDTINALGGKVTLTGQVLDASGKILPGLTVTWSSVDPSIATVSNGVVTAVAKGTARIVAKHLHLADTAIVLVAPAAGGVPTTVSVAPQTATLSSIGAAVQLSATVKDAQNMILPAAPVTWQSLNTAVATVDATGRVSAVSQGTARIQVTAGSAQDTATITVTVPPPPPVGGPPVNGATSKAIVEEVIGPATLPPGAMYDSLRTLALTWSDHHWKNWRANPGANGVHTINYYDFAALMYWLGALTDDAKWSLRADTLAGLYCKYACQAGQMVAPHQWQPRGVEIYARRTNDPVARAAVNLYGSKLVDQLDGTANWGYYIGGDNQNMDNRQVARSLLSVLGAAGTMGRADLGAVILSDAVPLLEAQQKRDGGARWLYPRPVNENAIFHGALLTQALGDAARRGYNDARIDVLVDNWLDDAWRFATPTRNCQGVTRVTLPYDYSGAPPACYHHTLNGLSAVPYAQRYARTRNPAHLQQASDLISGAVASETWDNVGKQFMEVARAIWAAGVVGRAQGY